VRGDWQLLGQSSEQKNEAVFAGHHRQVQRLLQELL
jgi:hypothetical protein